MTEKTLLGFLEDHDTYSGPRIYLKIFEVKEDVEYEHEDPIAEISVLNLVQECIKYKELLPIEIQKIIQPIVDHDVL